MVQISTIIKEIHTQNRNIGYILTSKDLFIGRIKPSMRSVSVPEYVDTIIHYTKISITGKLQGTSKEGCLEFSNAEVRGLDLIGFLFTVKLETLYVCD